MPKPSPRKSAGRATEKLTQPRLLADENTSHRLISACRRLGNPFPIVHIDDWREGSWLGLDDAALLTSCAEAGLVLVAFDRATLPWHAGQVLRAGQNHGGLVLFRRTVRSTDYGHQARLLTEFWADEGHAWDWLNRVVYLPKSTSAWRKLWKRESELLTAAALVGRRTSDRKAASSRANGRLGGRPRKLTVR